MKKLFAIMLPLTVAGAAIACAATMDVIPNGSRPSVIGPAQYFTRLSDRDAAPGA